MDAVELRPRDADALQCRAAVPVYGDPVLASDDGDVLDRHATRAHDVGLVAQLAGEGEVLRIARSTASQITKFDPVTQAAAKKFIKPIPYEELSREIDLFCELFARPEVMAALKKFVKDSGPMPYLP